MKTFNKSLCSVSIALALGVSASAFADERADSSVITPSSSSMFSQDEQPADVAAYNRANIHQSGSSNDSSISITGMGGFYPAYMGNANAEIVVGGNNNVSSIEQINTEAYGGFELCCNNWAWAYSGVLNGSSANDNSNSIIQVGGNNLANSEIQIGDYNTVSVYQDGVNGFGYAANQSSLKINGDANELNVTQVGLTEYVHNRVQFDITGDDNTANINVKTDGAFFGYNPAKTSATSYFNGNGNTLTADINDTGISDTYVEFTGDNNSISILTEGESPGRAANAHQIKMADMQGSGNTYAIESYGSAANHNLNKLRGDDNEITITNLQGFNNRTIVSNLAGNRNVIDITIDGGGNNQAKVGKNRGDENTTTVSVTGYNNSVTSFDTAGVNNITTATIIGAENNATFSNSGGDFSPTSGDNNEMIITQDGERNTAYYMDAGNDRYYETVQIGSDNFSSVRGLGDGKEVYVEQIGAYNSSDLTIDRVGDKDGKIGPNNYLTEVEQTGAFNEVVVNAKASANINIDQTGAYNEVDLTIIGTNPEYATFNAVVEIAQDGTGNIYEGEIHSGKWSHQYITQTGDDNLAHWEEHAGIQNKAWIEQEGDMNTSYVTLGLTGQTTQINFVHIKQKGGDYNEVDLDITGNRNGFEVHNEEWFNAGIAIAQIGNDNLVVGDDGFGFTINGDYNSLAFQQVGDFNTIAGSIVGHANTAQVIQKGNDNFASITMTAY
jgi:hypothetical protein